jgi:hypothetical protein
MSEVSSGLNYWYQQLVVSLSAAQSSDVNLRRSGEAAIHEFTSQCPDFVPILISFASTVENAGSHRHLAMILLSQHAKSSWKSLSSESRFALAAFAHRWSTQDVNLESHLRRLAMAILAIIFGASTEGEAEQLASSFRSQLQSSDDMNMVLCTIRSVCEIAKEVEYYRQMTLLRVCYASMQNIIRSLGVSGGTDNNNNRLVYYVVRCLRFCTHKLGEANFSIGFEDDEAEFVLGELIPHWSSLACECLAQYVGDSNKLLFNLSVAMDLCSTLSFLLDSFSDSCGIDFKTVTRMGWSLLETIEETYASQVRGRDNSSHDHESGYTSDGDRIDVEMLVLHIFEVVSASIANHDRREGNELEEIGVSSDHVVKILASYMHLSETQMELWVDSPNEFVSVEYDNLQEMDNLRHVCAEVLREICLGSKGVIYVAILSAVQKEFLSCRDIVSRYLSSPEVRENQEVVQVVFTLESYLWIFGAVGKGYVKALHKSRRVTSSNGSGASASKSSTNKYAAITAKAPPQEVIAMIWSVVDFILGFPLAVSVRAIDVTTETKAVVSLALLQYRSLWLCEEISYLFRGGTNFLIIAKRCERLLNPDIYLSLRIQACRTLSRILRSPKSYFDAVEAMQNMNGSSNDSSCKLDIPVILESLVDMTRHCNDNSLHFPLHLMKLLIKTHEASITEPMIQGVVKLSLEVMSRYYNDSLIVDAANDVLLQLLHSSPRETQIVMHVVYTPHAKNFVFNHSQGLPKSYVDMVIDTLSKVATISRDNGSLSQDIEHNADYNSCVLGVLETLTQFLVSSLPRRIIRGALSGINKVLAAITQEPFAHHALFHSMDVSNFARTLLGIACSIITGVGDADDDVNPVDAYDCFKPAIGLFCHLVLKGGDLLGLESLSSVLVIAHNVVESKNMVKLHHCLCMAQVHLLARNAILAMQLLTHVFNALSNSSQAAFFSTWTEIHLKMDSQYNAFVSSVALTEVIRVLDGDVATEPLRVQLLEMLVNGLPKILLSNDSDFKGTSTTKSTRREFAEYEHGTDDDDDDEFSSDEFESNEEDNENDYDADANADGDSDIGWEDASDDDGVDGSPFAPAEMYLSDMIGGKGDCCGGDDDDYTMALASVIPDDIMYSPTMGADPLLRMASASHAEVELTSQLQERVVSLLHFLRKESSFPPWMNEINPKNKTLIKTLLV